MLENMQAAEKEYRNRLENIAGGTVSTYEDEWDEKSLDMDIKILGATRSDPHRSTSA